jgi:subtilisin family serine protease
VAAALVAALIVAPAAGAAKPQAATLKRATAVRSTVLVKVHGRYTRAKAEAVAARRAAQHRLGAAHPPRVSSGPITRTAALRSAWAALDRDPGVADTDGTRPREHFGVTEQPGDALWTITDSIFNPTTQSEIAQPAWHWRIANFPAAWDYSHGSPQVPVVVIDTEFYIDHPDLKDKFLPGFNFNPLDTNSGTYRTFGGTGYNPSWADALARARAAGIVPVASAANDQQQRPGFTFYPAAFPGVVAVGATTPSDQIAFFSSTGNFVDVSAPGDPVLSTRDPVLAQSNYVQGYHVDGGTSMAAPIVSGLVALIKARRPDLTADEIEGIIEATAVDKGLAGKDQNYGWGRIDAGRALAAAVAYARPVPPAPVPVAVDSRARTKVRLTTLASLRVNHNKLFRIKGTVTPHIAGLTVRVQIRRSGASSYRTVKSTKSKAGGKVSVRIKIKKKGRYALRLGVVTTGSVVGSKSSSISLRVR